MSSSKLKDNKPHRLAALLLLLHKAPFALCPLEQCAPVRRPALVRATPGPRATVRTGCQATPERNVKRGQGCWRSAKRVPFQLSISAGWLRLVRTHLNAKRGLANEVRTVCLEPKCKTRPAAPGRTGKAQGAV